MTEPLKIQGAAQNAKARLADDAAQRKAAGAAAKSVILNAKDVQGEYDAYRALTTTLGGVRAQLTLDHLKAFQHNIRTVQSRFKAGIRARQVIDLSLKADIERSNQEIRRAVPVSAGKEPGAGGGALVRFVTNAGPDSDVQHHHVLVNFTAYGAAASGARGDAKKSAEWLRKQPLRIECTCGRWRFWYRFIATIGSYNAGRDETGFPKIRNPNLTGVACKHILRVMHEVESSPTVLNFLERLIKKARDSDNNAVQIRNTQKAADAQAQEQATNGSDVGESTARREKWRNQAMARNANASKRLAPSPPAQKQGAATRMAKNAAQALKNEEAFVQKAIKDVEKYGITMGAENIAQVRAQFRKDNPTPR